MRRTNHQLAARRQAPRAAGFSLIEMLVGLAVTSILLLAIVGAFDAGSKIARVETQLADMQQSLRASHRQVTRYVRMAGRGGLALSRPGTPVYQGPALSVRNSAGRAGDTGEIAVGYTDTPFAVVDTDILTVRGAFTTPVYQIDITDPAAYVLRDEDDMETGVLADATHGTVTVKDLINGVAQELEPLRAAFTDDVPEALILVSPMDERLYGVVEFDASKTIDGGNQITVGFKIQGLTHPEYSTLYNAGPDPSKPVLPTGLNSAVALGILEEYRFYVRQPPTPPPPSPGDPPGTPSPSKLSMARMFPGTEKPYLEELSNLAIDLADNVLDMQLGMAFDSNLGPAWTDQNGDGDINDDDREIYEAPNGRDDDWLFNNELDDVTIAPWNGSAPQPELYYLRLNLLARSQLREPQYQAPLLAGWEDILGNRINDWNLKENRMYHRRYQQTIIELRNL